MFANITTKSQKVKYVCMKAKRQISKSKKGKLKKKTNSNIEVKPFVWRQKGKREILRQAFCVKQTANFKTSVLHEGKKQNVRKDFAWRQNANLTQAHCI